MQQRVSFITLGVRNLAQSRRFYEAGLGWRPSEKNSTEGVVFFQMAGGLILALFGRDDLAQDIGLADSEGSGFSGIALAYNVHEQPEVAQVLAKAEQAGGRILKSAQDTSWGGHAGYFADPDGHMWEVAWNPHFTLTSDGQMILP